MLARVVGSFFMIKSAFFFVTFFSSIRCLERKEVRFVDGAEKRSAVRADVRERKERKERKERTAQEELNKKALYFLKNISFGSPSKSR